MNDAKKNSDKYVDCTFEVQWISQLKLLVKLLSEWRNMHTFKI